MIFIYNLLLFCILKTFNEQTRQFQGLEYIIILRRLQEATPAVQVQLQQPFYLYDERTLIPFPKSVTILHGGYRMSIPVGMVVAPVPVDLLRAGPVFVTTLFAIPAGPVPAPSPVR